LKWSEPKEYATKEPEMDNKVIQSTDVPRITPSGKIFRLGELD
jgi:hypothetical protein